MSAGSLPRGIGAAVWMAALAASASASAATFTVDRTDDDASATACADLVPADCSLRGAIIAANLNPGSTIVVPAGTYLLTIPGNTSPTAGELSAANAAIGDLDVTADGTTITGAGAAVTIIQQTQANDRVIEVNPGGLAGFVFHISGVTIRGGRETTGVGGAGLLSGGLNNQTFVTGVIFWDNRATGAGSPVGGGIGNTDGDLFVAGCSFLANSAAGPGGGIFFDGGADHGSLTVDGSTLGGNTSASSSLGGGAISISGPVTDVTVVRSSIAGNQATDAGGGGGAIANSSRATLSFHWSRLRKNTAATPANGLSIRSTGLTVVGASENWWGADAGPGANDVVSSTSPPSIATWLQLRLAASPTSVLAGQASALTADLYGLSGGGTLLAGTLNGLPAFPLPPGVIFHNAVLGTLGPAGTQVANGLATATFTAGVLLGTGSAAATIDAQTKSAAISIAAAAGSLIASINDASVGEGNILGGITLLGFTVSLSGASGTPVTVNYATADGTAKAGIDYTATTGTVTFLPGYTKRAILVPVLGNTTVEPNKTLFVNLTSASGTDIAKSQGTGTIVNDDPPAAAATIIQYRLYSPITLEHLYTTDTNEYAALGMQGWIQEGAAYTMFTSGGYYNGNTNFAVPFYRLYNPGVQQHHWTRDVNEVTVLAGGAWNYEGISGYVLPTAVSGTTPLYRLALPSPPLHLWTIDLNEYQVLTTQHGWVGEGIAGYVLP